jgi:hypothetical protein
MKLLAEAGKISNLHRCADRSPLSLLYIFCHGWLIVSLYFDVGVTVSSSEPKNMNSLADVLLSLYIFFHDEKFLPKLFLTAPYYSTISGSHPEICDARSRAVSPVL